MSGSIAGVGALLWCFVGAPSADESTVGKVVSRQTPAVHAALIDATLGDLFVMSAGSGRQQARVILLQVVCCVACIKVLVEAAQFARPPYTLQSAPFASLL